MVISLRDLSVAQLKKAAAIKERIEALEKELNGLLGTSATTSPGKAAGGRRRMSPAARARLSAAAKARWAKINAGKGKPAKAKRTMSASARKKISEAAKARWAKVRAGKK